MPFYHVLIDFWLCHNNVNLDFLDILVMDPISGLTVFILILDIQSGMTNIQCQRLTLQDYWTFCYPRNVSIEQLNFCSSSYDYHVGLIWCLV
jgi:hypothetical protein